MKHRSLIPAFALALLVTTSFDSRAATIDIETATIADIDAAFASGKLTSEQLVGMYLKRNRRLRQTGPPHQLGDHAQSESLGDRQGFGCGAQDQGTALADPRYSHRAKRQLQHLRSADDRRLADAGRLDSPSDAYIVKQLRDAGAIILAKTNLSEFAGGGGSVSGSDRCDRAQGRNRTQRLQLHGPADP